MSVATLGYLAGFLTTVAFVPQVIKTWKTKSVDDFSLWMLVSWGAGIACWAGYGILMSAPPLIIWNTISLVLAGAMLTMKLKFKNKIEEESEPILTKNPIVKDLGGK